MGRGDNRRTLKIRRHKARRRKKDRIKRRIKDHESAKLRHSALSGSAESPEHTSSQTIRRASD